MKLKLDENLGSIRVVSLLRLAGNDMKQGINSLSDFRQNALFHPH
ncbi:hypothetical protein [Microcoleus sp.]